MKLVPNFKKYLSFSGRSFERHPWIGLFILALLTAGILVMMILPDAGPEGRSADLIVKQAPPELNKNLRDSLVSRFKARQNATLPERPGVNPF